MVLPMLPVGSFMPLWHPRDIGNRLAYPAAKLVAISPPPDHLPPTSLPAGLCYRAAIEELISNAEANMLARAAGVNRAFIVSM